MHYRISSMRSRAKRDGKTVPTRSEIEGMAATMVCIGCSRRMNWLRSEGASTQATLQHDRDGGVRLLCLACNTRHAQHPGDTFYGVASNEKWCPDCDQILPKGSFAKDRSRPVGLKSYCRPCAAARYRSWEARHAAA
jgi:hypothetical protein